jgi:hypothetical protein
VEATLERVLGDPASGHYPRRFESAVGYTLLAALVALGLGLVSLVGRLS